MYKLTYYKNNLKNNIFFNCHYYDIEKCNLNILKKLGYKRIYDTLLKVNKEERNIRIGILSKNTNISKKLISFTNHSIRNFIYHYHIDEKDILFIQRDGLLINRFVKVNNSLSFLQPKHRDTFSFVIFIENNTYLAKSKINESIIIKGLPNKTLGLENFFKKHLKNEYLTNMKKINNIITDFFKTNNIEPFLIPLEKDYYQIITIDETIEINKKLIDEIDTKTLMKKIDRFLYFNKYIEPFIKVIIKWNLGGY